MLSTVSASDPSCSSSKVPAGRTDEDSGQLALHEPQTPNFSIRDYVFASRSKNIRTSWPFSRHLFKLYLNNDIQDLLPQFEPPTSVRTHCWRRQWASEEAKKIFIDVSQSGEVTLLSGDSKSAETDSCLPSEDDEHEVERTVAQISGPEINPELREETASASSAISDPMVSKVCPVCKTFASTSNTTLNAHMDQCLIMESGTNPFDNKLQKLKVKPRKKRLMEDIYATASSCTLEDLDKRNGSRWASDLALVAPNTDTSSVETKHIASQADHPVYIDSNGIKLRFLSMFSDKPQVLSSEEIGPRKNLEGVREGKILLISQKKNLVAKHSKMMKLKLKNRKLSSLKLFKDVAAPQVAGEETSLERLGSLVQLSGEHNQISSCGSATLRRWPCSKRSDLSKKVKGKGIKELLEHVNPANETPMLDKKNEACSSAVKISTAKFSWSSESKTMKLSAKDGQNKNSQRVGSSSSVLLKLSRSLGTLESSPRSTNKQLRMGRRKNFDKSTKLPFMPKTKRLSSLCVINSSTKILRKHRSLLRTVKRRRDMFSNEKSGLRKTTEAIVPEEMDSHGKDAEPRCSEKANRTSLNSVDYSSIIVETAHVKEPSLPLEENGTPMVQIMHDKQKKQECGVQSQAETLSAQKSSACLATTYGDLRPDKPRDSSSLASAQLAPTVDNNMVISRQQSVSPASSASTIFVPSPKDSHFKASNSGPVYRLSATPEKLALKSSFMVVNEGIKGEVLSKQQVLVNSKVKRQHEQLSDYQPCCCFQSIMDGTVPSSVEPKQLPDLYIKPVSSYAFSPYSSSQTGAVSTPVLESSRCSNLTKTCSDFGSPSQSCGTPTQSSTSSIFRLMGKNLMVMNIEQSAQLPKIHSPIPDNSSNPLGFCSFAGLENQQGFSNVVHTITASPLPRNMKEKTYMATDLIAVHDSPKDHVGFRSTLRPLPVFHPMIERPFPYLQQQSQLLPRDNGFRPYLINGGSYWELQAPIWENPVVFHPPFYHPQSLR